MWNLRKSVAIGVFVLAFVLAAVPVGLVIYGGERRWRELAAIPLHTWLIALGGVAGAIGIGLLLVWAEAQLRR